LISPHQEFPHSEALSIVGFVLNVPIFSDNVWHNVHWLIPAVARVHGEVKLQGLTTTDMELILFFAGYSFTETPLAQQDETTPDTLAKPQQSLEELFVKWLQPLKGLLKMISLLPPLLIDFVKRRCYSRLLWGHSEMRADRQLLHAGATGSASVDLFRSVLGKVHGHTMHAYLAAQGARAKNDALYLTFIQRDPGHGRSFTHIDDLIAIGLRPLPPGTGSNGSFWNA